MQLKELLKARDLSIVSNKANLILHLQEHDLEIWKTAKAEVLSGIKSLL